MQCSNGHEVSEGAGFCRECGVSVAPAVSETTTEYDYGLNQNTTDDWTASASENPKPILKEKAPTKSKVPIIGALAGLALIGGVAGAVMHGGGGDAITSVSTPVITSAKQQLPQQIPDGQVVIPECELNLDYEKNMPHILASDAEIDSCESVFFKTLIGRWRLTEIGEQENIASYNPESEYHGRQQWPAELVIDPEGSWYSTGILPPAWSKHTGGSITIILNSKAQAVQGSSKNDYVDLSDSIFNKSSFPKDTMTEILEFSLNNDCADYSVEWLSRNCLIYHSFAVNDAGDELYLLGGKREISEADFGKVLYERIDDGYQQGPSDSSQTNTDAPEAGGNLDVSFYREILANQIESLLEPCTTAKYVAPLGCELVAWEDTNYTAMSQLERNWLQYPEVVLAPSWQSPSDVARNGAADIGIDEDMQAVLVNGTIRLNYQARNTSAENWQGPLIHDIPFVDANGEPIAFPVVFDSSGWPLVFDDDGILNHCNTACMRAGQGDASGKVEAQTPTTTLDSAHPGPWMMHLTCTDRPGRGIQWSSDANGDPVGDDVEIAAPSCDVGLTSDLPKAGANCYWITNAYNHNTLSDHVNIRSSQSSDSPSNIIGEIPAGAGPFDFEVCSQEGWVRARYNGILGWVSNSLDIR